MIAIKNPRDSLTISELSTQLPNFFPLRAFGCLGPWANVGGLWSISTLPHFPHKTCRTLRWCLPPCGEVIKAALTSRQPPAGPHVFTGDVLRRLTAHRNGNLSHSRSVRGSLSTSKQSDRHILSRLPDGEMSSWAAALCPHAMMTSETVYKLLLPLQSV